MADNTTSNYTHFNTSPGSAQGVTFCHVAGRRGKANAVGDDDHDQSLGLQQPADDSCLARRPVEDWASDARSEQLAAGRHVIVYANCGREKPEMVAGGGSAEAAIFDVTEREPSDPTMADSSPPARPRS